jgi:hypothetical protein
MAGECLRADCRFRYESNCKYLNWRR